MSIHNDTSTTPQRTRYGLLQGLSILSLGLFARGTISLGRLLAAPGGIVHPGHSPSREDASRDRRGSAPLGPPQLRWRRVALQPPEVLRENLVWNSFAHVPDGVFSCISWNTRGLLGPLASSQCSRELKHAYLTGFTRNNDVICFQETHGKDESFQAIQIFVAHFGLFGTFTPNNANAGVSSILI